MSISTIVTAPRQPKVRRKPERRVRLCLRPDGKGVGVVKITVGKDTADYFLTNLDADFGRAFRLEKIGAEEVYHVNLDREERHCDCKGFGRWSHCKHADGLAALIAAGRL